MINIVAIGKTEEKAKRLASWIVQGDAVNGEYRKAYQISSLSANVEAAPVWPECATGRPSGDAIIIFCKEESDLAGIEELVKHYANVPVKFIIYEGAIAPQQEREKEWNAIAFKMQSTEALVQKLIDAHNDLAKLVKNVFDHFDHDKSGYIDLKELKDVAKELGVDMPLAEAELLYNELDINKDGKISLPEFTEWWKSGRQGKTYKLSELVIRKIQKSHSLTLAADLLNQYGGLQDLKEEEPKYIKTSFGIHFNKVKTTGGLLIEYSFMSQGKALDAHLQQYKSCLTFPEDSSFAAIAFGCKKDPKQATADIKELVENAITIMTSSIPQLGEFVTKVKREIGLSANNKVVIGITPTADALAMVDMLTAQFTKTVPNKKVEQTVEIFIKFATDLAKLSTEDKSILEMVLFDGISIDLKGRVLQQFASQIAIMGQQAENIPGPMGELLKLIKENGMYFNGCDGELEFESDPEFVAQAKQKLGEGNPMNMPLKAFKAMIAPMAVQQITNMPLISKAHEIFKNEIDSIELFFSIKGKIGMKLYLELPGLGTLLNFE